MLEYETREGNYYYRCVIGTNYYAMAIHVDDELELYRNETDLLPEKTKKLPSGVLKAMCVLSNGGRSSVHNPV
jgi:hypothetical protein